LRLTQIAVTLPMMAVNFAKMRRMMMNEKLLDVLAATAIGIGFAVLLVAWWSS
jgi:multisubunit Na+/H+ antiporter MnhB subunit